MSTPTREEERMLGARLLELWLQQAAYNERVRAVQPEEKDWSSIYLLGAVGEIDEILEVSNWKRHRRHGKPVVRENLADELADLTKYVLSLWQYYEFAPLEMLQALQRKGEQLDARLRGEFFPPTGQRVLVTDLDGTVADFRRGFQEWWGQTDTVSTLHLDLDNAMPFATYEGIKDEFEAGGGYARLPAYPDAVELLRAEQRAGAEIMVTTARPADRFRRVWQDTADWLRERGIRPYTMLFGRDERIVELLRLAQGKNQLLLLEDDATLALRAAHSGIPVYLRDQPYNQNAQHRLITRFERFPERVRWDMLRAGAER